MLKLSERNKTNKIFVLFCRGTGIFIFQNRKIQIVLRSDKQNYAEP